MKTHIETVERMLHYTHSKYLQDDYYNQSDYSRDIADLTILLTHLEDQHDTGNFTYSSKK